MSEPPSFGEQARRSFAAGLLKRRMAAAQNREETEDRIPLGDASLLKQAEIIRRVAASLDIGNPFFRTQEGLANAESMIGGRVHDNFASYNYLGLNGHPEIAEAAQRAIATYGTSVSASRLASGERPIHHALEGALAEIYRTEACLTFVSGHATNVTVLGILVDRSDIILHDALIHNSVVQGAQLSGARRVSFAHNDPADLERQLIQLKGKGRRVLVVIEGHYSMDGDIPDLREFSAVTRRHKAWLMVDEAHSLGVLGERGFGLAEHAGIDPGVVDIWMGTLSKTLASCGGYIAASSQIVEYLRYMAPGFVFSVGLAPPLAAAALAALQMMQREPARVTRLRANGAAFLNAAKANGLQTGFSAGVAIVPVMVGSSIRAAMLSQQLLAAGINVQPILYPAVADGSARLRFFLSSEHQEDRIRHAATETATAIRNAGKLDYRALMSKVAGWEG
jgi:8-amino-7-oxononanoate synthase